MAPTVSEKMCQWENVREWLTRRDNGCLFGMWHCYCNISVAAVKVFKEDGVKVFEEELGGKLRCQELMESTKWTLRNGWYRQGGAKEIPASCGPQRTVRWPKGTTWKRWVFSSVEGGVQPRTFSWEHCIGDRLVEAERLRACSAEPDFMLFMDNGLGGL